MPFGRDVVRRFTFDHQTLHCTAAKRDVAEPAPGAAPTMCLELDGTGVSLRKPEVEEPPGTTRRVGQDHEVDLVPPQGHLSAGEARRAQAETTQEAD